MGDTGRVCLAGTATAVLGAIFLLAGCGARDGITSSLPAAPALERPASADSKLAGEEFSSDRARGSCSASPWSFHVSGKARGPFVGTFTARGELTPTLYFQETFQIRSGSKVTSGSAVSRASGTPSGGCSKSGKLGFDFPILQYRWRHSTASGYAALSGTRFVQHFN